MVKFWKIWSFDRRYWLSAAGIIIGVACAVTAVSLIEGGKASLQKNFGVHGLSVYELESTDGLEAEDARLIAAKMPEAEYAAPVLKAQGQLKSYKKSENVEVLGVSEKYDEYMNLELVKGNYIRENDMLKEGKVAVIDDITAEKLYGTTEVIGQELEVTIGGEKSVFLVSGVVKNYRRNIETLLKEDIEGFCFIPATTAEAAYSGFDVSKIIALVKSSLHEEEAAVKLTHILEREHEARGTYTAERYSQLANVAGFIDRYLVLLIIVSASSLLLGSVGVMNMLMVSLSEMNREIGLLKFYGAGIRDIQYELIFKALAACITSGIAGMAAGVLIGGFIGSFININTSITINSLALALTASGAAGIISGIYPAAKAADVNAAEVVWAE